jgi:hypothetical protein
MLLFLIAILIRIMVEVVQIRRDKKEKAKSQPRCLTCVHSHVQNAANARRVISCTYGGTVRPMKLDVLDCTDYENRYRKVPARSIGFVREIAAAK